ncbi:cyclin-dependent kinase inhibitor 6-like [Triticum dicoccoides]|uniref:cyclin-dependent kinase inhibitor 6-like n=1 Tax=Triticum dicoccoides TaxID=85692 RepID=UPI00188F91E9|nr:cyclin-dependent kinase inhibitor 6-like [Triticum dicoccoides]
MAATAAAIVTATAAASSCSKRESVGIAAPADLTKKAKKGRSPPAEEMEAFFAAAEGDVARRFAAKYNYDVVTDAPMDGRYEWVRVRP